MNYHTDSKKNILVIGSGGREALLAYELSKSNKTNNIYLAPGNETKYPKGIKRVGIKPDYPYCDNFISYLKNKDIKIVISGSENDLAKGLGDTIRLNGISFLGVGASAAILEADKSYASIFRKTVNIPQPDFKIFSGEMKYHRASNYATKKFQDGANGVVIKYHGLAGGKGVAIAKNRDEYYKALESVQTAIVKSEGHKNAKIIIEDFIDGVEISATAILDKNYFHMLSYSQDYKRSGDNDTGFNTGGMGAVTLNLDEELDFKIKNIILKTKINADKIGRPLKCGFLYVGLMIDKNKNPYVLEYNTRLGDPETQVIIPRTCFYYKHPSRPKYRKDYYHKYDIGDLLYDCAENSLVPNDIEVFYKKEHYATIVMAAKGYPGDYSESEGKLITGIEKAQKVHNVFVNLAGTTYRDGNYYVKGSRNINVIAKGKTPQKAIKQAYRAARLIKSDGLFYRKDIGCNIPDFAL